MFRLGNFYLLLSQQKNIFWGGVPLCIQFEKVAKHDSNMKTILDRPSTPVPGRGITQAYWKFYSIQVTCGPVVLQTDLPPPPPLGGLATLLLSLLTHLLLFISMSNEKLNVVFS